MNISYPGLVVGAILGLLYWKFFVCGTECSFGMQTLQHLGLGALIGAMVTPMIMAFGPGFGYKNIGVSEFATLKSQPETILLDVRTPGEIQNGVISKNALTLDISNKFSEKITSLDKEKTYLVYCASGMRSAKACSILHKNGFTNLYNLRGGINAWNEPLEKK
jgi:rhodanese-related sulfurtransferase